jgi:hypothetical protein
VAEFIFSAAVDGRRFSQFEHAGLIVKKPADGIVAELPLLGNLSDGEVGFDWNGFGFFGHLFLPPDLKGAFPAIYALRGNRVKAKSDGNRGLCRLYGLTRDAVVHFL